MSPGRKNVYTCSSCKKTIVTVDRDEGTTPFILAFCKATSGCGGEMVSSFYTCNQSLAVQYEWFRPGPSMHLSPATKEHVRKGGLILRSIS